MIVLIAIMIIVTFLFLRTVGFQGAVHKQLHFKFYAYYEDFHYVLLYFQL